MKWDSSLIWFRLAAVYRTREEKRLLGKRE
jgi:hypothetical protein